MFHKIMFRQKNNRILQEASISPLKIVNAVNHLILMKKNSPGIYRNNEDVDFKKAIELSLHDQKNISFNEPLNLEQRVRIQGFPVGLKNVGNSKDHLIV